MSDIVIFDKNATPQRVKSYRRSVHTPGFSSRVGNDVVINPDLSALEDVPLKYWKHESGAILEYTQAEKDAQEAADTASHDLATRQGAKARMEGFDVGPLGDRATLKLIMNEFNILRAEHSLAPRTFSQFLAAHAALVDGGTVDS